MIHFITIQSVLTFGNLISGSNMLGAACYFATTSSYSSQDMFSPANQRGERFMFLVRVITGDYCKGDPKLKTAPYKPPTADAYDRRYDSVVNEMSNPTMFAVFHDASAYPDYIIKYQY